MTLGRLAPLLVPLGLVVTALASPASTSRADEPAGVDAFLGTWRNTAGDSGESHILERVTNGTEPMRAVRRTVARRRILESNPPVPRLEIQQEGSTLRVTFPGVRSYAAALGGPAQAGRAPDGSSVRVRLFLRGARLHERIDAGQGHSTNVYSLSGGGARLTLRSTIRSPHLPGPITYTLRFRRASS